MAERLGTIFVELDLDATKFEKGQKAVLEQSRSTSLSVEKNWKLLGEKSDTIYQAMANGAINAYNMISNRAKTSAEEQFRAQSAFVSKINTLNTQVAQNPLYDTLGIKSVASINAQKAAIIASYDTIKTSGTASAQDLINIERAKNSKLAALNKEMVGDHEMSMAAMTRAILRFYAAYYVVSNAAMSIGRLFAGGVKAIDDLKTSTIAVAAQITNMQGESGDVVENYKNNLKYAEALNVKMMEIDANSFANYQQIILMNRAMNQHGVILDLNKQKQVDAFTALTNTIALLTAGQGQEQQASQEMNALMSGQVKTTDRVAKMIDSLIKKQGDYKDGLKELVKEGEKHGDTLERLQPYLVGVAAASGDISKTWMAVGSSIETAWGILQRSVFADFYKELVTSGQDAVEWVKRNADEVARYIKIGFNAVSNIIQGIWGVLKGFAPLAKDFGMAAGLVAYGWGGVFAALKPIGELIGNQIALTYDLVKMIGNAAVALGALIARQPEAAKAAWAEAKKNYAEVERLSIRQYEIVKNGIADSVAAYAKQYEAAKKATSVGINTPKIKGGAGGEDEAGAIKKAADEYARLSEKMREYRRSVAEKSEMEGMGELRKTLYENQLAAEKLIEEANKLTGAERDLTIEAIKQEQAMKDKIAVSKETEAQRKLAVDGVKKETNEIISAQKDRLNAERDIYKDLRGYSENYYDATITMIEEQAAAYRNLGIDEVAVSAWVTEELYKADIKRLQDSDSYFDGWKAGLLQLQHDVMTFGKAGEEMFKSFSENSKSTLSNVLFDGMKGEYQSFMDYWESFTDALLRKWTDTMAQMLVDWAMTQAQMEGSGGLSGWLNSAASAIGSIFGGGSNQAALEASGFQGSYSLMGNADGNAFQGGNVLAFANGGIINRPTLFPMAQGMGLMGEAGPEAVMPLTRTAGGKLGVEASGGGNHVNINIINNNGSDVSTQQSETSQGLQLDVMIDQAVAKKLGQSGTASNRAMKNTFGAKESLVTR